MGRACAVNCTMGAALIFLCFCLVPDMTFAASTGDTTVRLRKLSRRAKTHPEPTRSR